MCVFPQNLRGLSSTCTLCELHQGGSFPTKKNTERPLRRGKWWVFRGVGFHRRNAIYTISVQKSKLLVPKKLRVEADYPPWERSHIPYQPAFSWADDFPNFPFAGACFLVPWNFSYLVCWDGWHFCLEVIYPKGSNHSPKLRMGKMEPKDHYAFCFGDCTPLHHPSSWRSVIGSIGYRYDGASDF